MESDAPRDFEGLVVMLAGAVVLFSIGVQVAQDAVALADLIRPAIALTNLQVRLGDAPGVGWVAPLFDGRTPQVVGVEEANIAP